MNTRTNYSTVQCKKRGKKEKKRKKKKRKRKKKTEHCY